MPRIQTVMARGWESKGVEEQLAEYGNAAPASSALSTAEQRDRADRQRERQNLELKREQILNTRTSNAHRRASLAAALRDIELQLEALEKQS